MALKASSKPTSTRESSIATIGLEAMASGQSSGANRVERDSLRKAARRAHAGACGKQTAKGSPQGEKREGFGPVLDRRNGEDEVPTARGAPESTVRGQQPKQRNATTRRLAIMNLAIRGIEDDIGNEHADTFRHVQHPGLLANPPFNDSDCFRN